MGFPPGDAKGVFAKFAQLPILAIPAERAGGLAAPKFAGVDGLSRLTGPVSGVDGFVDGHPLTAEQLVGNTKLLGLIELKDVIAAVTDGADPFPVAQAPNLFDTIDTSTAFLPRPVITTVPTASGVETRFIWKPRISDPLSEGFPAILSKSSGMGLVLKGRITAGTSSPTSPPAFSVQGKLSKFALSLLDLITISFEFGRVLLAVQQQGRRQAACRRRRVFRQAGVRAKAATAVADHEPVRRAPGADAARRRDRALRHPDSLGPARRHDHREPGAVVVGVAPLRRGQAGGGAVRPVAT